MKNASSDGMTFIRRSDRAGNVLPPSLFQPICGAGRPAAAQSKRAVEPVRTVMLFGLLEKTGNTAMAKKFKFH